MIRHLVAPPGTSPRSRPIHVGYCSNIFPAESLADTRAQLLEHMVRLRAVVAPREPMGVGLRLSDLASREILEGDALRAFADDLAEAGLYVFTINAFPFGRFHGGKVKEGVYLPDWTAPERRDYSIRAARALAGLLARAPALEGIRGAAPEGSVSTVPLTFKEFAGRDAGHDAALDADAAGASDARARLDAMIANLADCALAYERLSLETGLDLHLGLEPEPLCLIETSAETVAFFEDELWHRGPDRIAREVASRAEAEAILRRRIGVCHDACHMAVEFETPAEGVERYARAGIRASKVQISSALRVRPDAASLAELERFADAVYLHQTIARFRDGRVERRKDIAPALRDFAPRLAEIDELRVHCHVPLDLREHRGLASTSDFVDGLLAELAARSDFAPAHFELETYTRDVLPEELRRDGIDAMLARETNWFLERPAIGR